MRKFRSLDKRNKWMYKLGLCLISFSSWAASIKGWMSEETPISAGSVLFILSAVLSTTLVIFYEKIKLKGFVVFCAAGSTLMLAALFSGFDQKIFGIALSLLSISGLAAFFLGDKVDQDTEEKKIRIRKFW